MTRAIFMRNHLDQYLWLCQRRTGKSLPQLASIISVNRHTLNDWRREKLLPNLEKLQMLSTYVGVPLPATVETKPDNWGASKAGYIR